MVKTMKKATKLKKGSVIEECLKMITKLFKQIATLREKKGWMQALGDDFITDRDVIEEMLDSNKHHEDENYDMELKNGCEFHINFDGVKYVLYMVKGE